MVDTFFKWVETFPTSKQDSAAIAKALITDIGSCGGVPQKISSDSGTPFISDAIKQFEYFLGIDQRQHYFYHPASGGAVERENGTLKAKLAKCCEESGLSWTKVLPIVLVYMRMRKRAHTQIVKSH